MRHSKIRLIVCDKKERQTNSTSTWADDAADGDFWTENLNQSIQPNHSIGIFGTKHELCTGFCGIDGKSVASTNLITFQVGMGWSFFSATEVQIQILGDEVLLNRSPYVLEFTRLNTQLKETILFRCNARNAQRMKQRRQNNSNNNKTHLLKTHTNRHSEHKYKSFYVIIARWFCPHTQPNIIEVLKQFCKRWGNIYWMRLVSCLMAWPN